MKKLKKIVAAMTTAAISAVSLCSMFTVSANSGRETFRIYVDVPANSGVSKVLLNLRYTPSVTDVCRFYKGTMDNRWRMTVVMDSGIYCGINVVAGTDQDLTSPGTLGVITMIAPSSTRDLFDLVDINIQSISNYTGSELPTSRIRISNIMVGDVNSDGKVDSSDATLLNNYLNGNVILSGNALRAADTTGDFGISDDDLTHLNNYLNGTVNNFDA